MSSKAQLPENAVLARFVSEVFPQASGHEVGPLAGDASNRSYFRIDLSDCEQARAILMVLADPDPHKGAEEVGSGTGEVDELPFVNMLQFLEVAGLRVPKLFGYERELGLLLLEDLGDELMGMRIRRQQEDGDDEAVVREYRRALDMLVHLQVEGTKQLTAAVVANHRMFGYELLRWELEHFTEWTFDKKGIEIEPPHREVIDAEFDDIAREITAWKTLLVHRDYHSRNLLFTPDDELAVIDFQDALLGPAEYDIASLLRDSYVTLDRETIDELIDYYLSARADAAGSAGLYDEMEADEFRERFDLMALQRNLKAAGRFEYIDQFKGNPGYLASIPPTLMKIADTLGRYDRFEPLRDALSPYLAELSAL